MAIKDYHDKLPSLHKQAWDDYKVKRVEHIEVQMEQSQHQERIRNVLGSCSDEATGSDQYLDRDGTSSGQGSWYTCSI